MSNKIKISLACEEANHVCDKSQYKEASFWDKVKLNIHLIYCRACRKYSKNNGKLTTTIKKSKIECLKKEEKDSIKKTFDEVLENHPN